MTTLKEIKKIAYNKEVDFALEFLEDYYFDADDIDFDYIRDNGFDWDYANKVYPENPLEEEEEFIKLIQDDEIDKIFKYAGVRYSDFSNMDDVKKAAIFYNYYNRLSEEIQDIEEMIDNLEA